MNEDKARDAKVRDAIALLRRNAKSIVGYEAHQDAAIELLTQAISPPELERICGLTMEEWQVVIDGGYLCEFGTAPVIDKLATVSATDFQGVVFAHLAICRPYRAVGHVQPYFENGECREYLEGLGDSALVSSYNANRGWRFNHSDCVDWVSVDKFIVLDSRE